MKKRIVNLEKFQCIKDNWAVTLPSGTYTLYMSADGANYTAYENQINGNDTLVVAGCTPGMYFYIDGLTSEVEVLL